MTGNTKEDAEWGHVSPATSLPQYFDMLPVQALTEDATNAMRMEADYSLQSSKGET